MTAKQHALLEHAIDYAGLFPPAGLEMAGAVANYRRYREGADSWALGRFVCPVGRLEEFAAARGSGGGVWPLAAVAGGEPHAEAAAIARFNQDHFNRARIEAVEAKSADAEAVRLRVAASAGLECYCELSASSPEFAAAAAAAHALGARLKLRTGGVAANAIPALDLVLDFLRAARELGLSFKATAGLHHPYRGTYPLTDVPDAPQGLMYGFLNVALGAVALAAGYGPGEAERILGEEDPAALKLERWSDEQIAAGRRFFTGFGSCSFEEPLQWLHPPA
ncbi:MAG: hypothetical protein ACRD04_11185 [Terriglobales bacterium]